MKVLDLSGYMFSGKGAASDLIKEFDGFSVPYRRSEFDLLRIPHGLIDLRCSLVDKWSWVRSDSAIREFIQIATTMGNSPQNIFQKLFIVGFGYNARYHRFNEATNEFIDSLTDDTWKMQWPYEMPSLYPAKYAWLRVKAKLKGIQPWPVIDFRLCSGADFDKYAKRYLQKILSLTGDINSHTIVTHNMLEPYDPTSGFCFFDDIHSIVVDRDVRDIYMTSLIHSDGFNDKVPVYSRITGAFNIDTFIKRQKILRSKTNYTHNDRVLRVQFEDLVVNYENTVKKIILFLDINQDTHVRKFKHFSPKKSAENIRLWENAPKWLQADIKKLEKELPELCV